MNLVGSSQPLEVSIVPDKGLEDLVRQFCVEAQSSHFRLLDACLSEILIVKVVEASVFLLRHVPQSMECLNVAIKSTRKIK